MAPPSSETVWNLDEKELLDLLNSGVFVSNPKQVMFYAPSFMHYKAGGHCSSSCFPTFSVTGKTCALNCKHCGGKLLGTMQSTGTPAKLFEAAEKLKTEGGVGCLVSGGSTLNGSGTLCA